MGIENTLSLLTAFCLAWACGTARAVLDRSSREWFSTSVWLLSLAALASVVWASSVAASGQNSVVHLLAGIRRFDPRQICSVAGGLGIGALAALATTNASWAARASGLLATVLALASLTALALQNELGKYLARRELTSIVSNPGGVSVVASGFAIDLYHESQFKPVQIAVSPQGRVFYAHHEGSGVNRIDFDGSRKEKWELQVARDLTRINGLAFHKGDLYVSRSGRMTTAHRGKLSEAATGAVTLLKDVDGDGVMDYFHDVVSGLPGAQAPDPVHQNNGIAFSRSGHLYVAVGAHANKEPLTGKFEGSIVRARSDGADMAVFARGMRNPFDCAAGPEDELFCTDNDIGYSTSDELNHVVQGGHYGHPYVDPNLDPAARHPEGTIPPILTSRKNSLQGIVWSGERGLPEEYRNCLYIVGHPGGEIFRVRLFREGKTFRAESVLFATVPQALDITIDNDGVIYVSCFHTRRIYRIYSKSPPPAEKRSS